MTYTILAADPAHRVVGVAAATGGHAVGAFVPALDPSVGAVASQAWVNPALRHTMLDVLRAGGTAEEAVDRALATDGAPERRQAAVITFDGQYAAHTGAGCTAWSGERHGRHFIVLGNYLTGPEVLDAVVNVMEAAPDTVGHDALGEAWLDPSGDLVAHKVPGPEVALASVLMRALEAGQSAGGDARGPLSACVAMCQEGPAGTYPPDLDIDLRVDSDLDPVGRLKTILDEHLYEKREG